MVFRTVRRHHLQIREQTTAVLHLNSASSQGNPNPQANAIERHKEDTARFRNLSMAMFLVYLVFLLCSFPLMCVLLMASFHGRDTAVETAFNFTMALVFINSTLNPFLYCFRLKNLRREVWNTLRSLVSVWQGTYWNRASASLYFKLPGKKKQAKGLISLILFNSRKTKMGTLTYKN